VIRALFVALALAINACVGGADTATAAGVPDYAVATLDTVRHTGIAPSGYRGGTRFYNDGRDGGTTLPVTASDGSSIRYQEWDVHPWTRGVNRGAERLITGSDGSAYYTADHYRTFVRITP
jgi:guanyl-specific ribonuclease Sa